MPLQVKGEDGRILHDQLGDGDAKTMARAVHQNTGETLTLTPWRLQEGIYELDPEMATQFPAPAEDEAETAEEPKSKRSKKN